MKSAMIRARIEPDLKHDVEQIFSRLGLSTTEAITLFYRQVCLYRGLPFEVKLPNKTTLKTFQDTDAGKGLTECDSANDMFKRLKI